MMSSPVARTRPSDQFKRSDPVPSRCWQLFVLEAQKFKRTMQMQLQRSIEKMFEDTPVLIPGTGSRKKRLG